jgi:hypothetical protein
MDPSVPVVNSLLTVGGLTIFVTAITEVVLRAWKPTPEQKDRFGPLLAMGLAVVAGLLASLYLGGDGIEGILLGVIVGWGSMGVHDTASVLANGG